MTASPESPTAAGYGPTTAADGPRQAAEKSRLDNVGTLVAELRHELGNPLNSIKGALTLLRRNAETFSPEKVATYLDATLGEVVRLERLLGSLRRLSEPKVLAPPTFDAAEVLEDFIAGLGYEIERRSIVFKPEVSAAGKVCCDREACAQVLLDLAQKAVQRLLRVEEPCLELRGWADAHRGFYLIELRSNGRDPEKGREMPFASFQLGPREDDFRLAWAISRQILLQQGATVTDDQLGAQEWVSRIALPLVPQVQPPVSGHLAFS